MLLTQTLQVGKKRAAPIRSARAQREAALAEAEQTSLEVTRSVQEAYFEALQADANQQLAMESLRTARTFAQAAQTQYEAGDVAQNQVVRSQIEVAKAQQEVAAAEKERADRYAELRSLLDLAESTALSLTDSLAATPKGYPLADLVAAAMRNRPDLRAARLQETASEAEVQAARTQSRPDPLWEFRHSSLDLAGGDTGVRAGISFPLLDLGKQRAQVQEAEAVLAEQRATRENAERAARLEAATALHALDLAREQLDSFEAGRVARAKELLSMAQVGYEQGATSYLEMVDAQQAYRSEQGAYVQAQASYHLAQAALQQAVGGELP